MYVYIYISLLSSLCMKLPRLTADISTTREVHFGNSTQSVLNGSYVLNRKNCIPGRLYISGL